MSGSFGQGFAQSFAPSFQSSGARFMSERQAGRNNDLQRQLLTAQLAAAEGSESRSASAEERAQAGFESEQDAAKREEEKLFGQLAAEANQISQAANLTDELAATGQLSEMQVGLLKTLAPEQRGAALAEITGGLSAGPTAADQADLAKIQADIAKTEADTRLSNAKLSDVGQTALIRNLKAAGIDPDSDRGRQIIQDTATGAKQGADAAKIAAEKATAKGRAEASVKRETELAETLTELNTGSSAGKQLLELSEDAVSGPFAEQRNAIAKAADQFGGRGLLEAVDFFVPGDLIPDSPEAGEIFEGIRAQFDLEARALQKGPQTDQDAKVIAATTPQLSDSKEARESKARRFLAVKGVVGQRLQAELDLLDSGATVVEARKQALEAFPSPDFDKAGNVIQKDLASTPVHDLDLSSIDAEIERLERELAQ